MTQYTPMESGAAPGKNGARRLCCVVGAVLTLSTLTNLLLAATLFSGGIRTPTQLPVEVASRQQQPSQPDEMEGRRQAQMLPPMRYRFTSFAVTDPEASAEFVQRYLGATLLAPSEFTVHRQVGPRAIVRGVQFQYGNGVELSSHDVYFISEDSAVPDGGVSIADWESERQALHHFELEDQWDWWQDWHLCLHVDTPDPVAALPATPTCSSSSFFHRFGASKLNNTRREISQGFSRRRICEATRVSVASVQRVPTSSRPSC